MRAQSRSGGRPRQHIAGRSARCQDVQPQDKDEAELVDEDGDSASASPGELLEVAQQELAKKSELLIFFREQHENLQKEKQQMSVQCTKLQEEVQKLTKQLEATSTSELEQLHCQLRDAKEQLAQTKDENARALKDADSRIEELEKELHKVHQQMFDHLSDSQMNTSEIRGEVEQTRWQLLQDSGAQKTELLRARQDMVNRIIQMGEKSREVEMNMRKLQLDGKHLTAEIAAIIHKLGDPEQQELIHGTIKALELENQVLKLRNAQLELAGNTETVKGSNYDPTNKLGACFGEEEKCSVGMDNVDLNSKYSDSGSKKADDDSFDTESTKSERSELSVMKKKLDSQIAQLQTNMEMYERDIESYEVLKSDWTAEKRMLEQHLCDLKMQLKEKEEALALVTAQKGLLDVKKSSSNFHNEAYTTLQKNVEDLTAQLSRLQEEKDQVQQGKLCLSSEVEAMAKIVQDLESQLARAQEENAGLTNSLEELDEQHQGAIDQLLKVKQQLQKQNDALESELTNLKQQKTSVELAATQTDPLAHELHAECRRNVEKEFQEKISKLLTFEIPKDYYSLSNNNQNEDVLSGTVEALAKMCVECKWKRDTLERKVAELMKDLRDTKHTCEEKSKSADELERECRMLKSMIEELMVSKSGGGEGLAPIPENSEEAEAMELKMMTMENEIEVLREARSNLEADAKKLREEGQGLVRRLETVTATLRNQENLETEVNKWQEVATNAEQRLQEILTSRDALDEELATVRKQLQKLEAESHHQAHQDKLTIEEQKQEIAEHLRKKEGLQNQISDMEHSQLVSGQDFEASEIKNSNLVEENKQLQSDIERLEQELLAARTHADMTNRQLADVSQIKLECDKHIERLGEELGSYKNRVSALELKLSDTETQSSEAMNSKSIIEKKLADINEDVNQSRREISELKSEKILAEEIRLELENRCAELKIELCHKDERLSNLEEEVRKLSVDAAESECSFKTHDTDKEVERWKEMAEASERQLSEALLVRDELEQECKRLYMIENRVHNQEHLDRELERLKKLSEGMEEDSNKLLTDKLSLEQQLETTTKHLRYVEEAEKEAAERAAIAEQKLMQVLHDATELEEKCRLLHVTEEQLKEMERNFIKTKEQSIRLEQELKGVVSAKSDLEAECKRLLGVEGRLRNQETLEQELRELQQKWEAAQKELSDAKLKAADQNQKVEGENSMEDEIRSLKEKQQRIQSEIDARTQENDSLKAENYQLQQILSKHEVDKERHFQDTEATQMAKETIANLSKIIKDKDMEIEALKLKSDTLVTLLQEKDKLAADKDTLLEQLNRLNSERMELIRTVQIKHQESVQYHNEIQRLTDVLTQEMENSKALTHQHEELVHQYEEKQKQTLIMDKELAAAKKRIQELEISASEDPEVIQKVPEGPWEEPAHATLDSNKEMTSTQQKDELTLPEDLRVQLETLQSECSRMADSLLQEQTRNKYLQNEVQEQYEKESVLMKELERLRLHLLAVEEGYTQEALKYEEQVKDLQNKLLQAEERIKNSSTAYTSASIRANQHVESLQGQARLIAQQRDEIQQKLSAAEDQVQHHSAALRNLQIVLEQFQKDKEREINSATGRLQQQLQEAQRHHEELNGEISVLKVQLAEAKEGLSAASRLGEQLDKKSDIINSLKEEVTKLRNQLQESENRVQSASLNVEGKIDRYLVKNLVLGYFMAPQNTRPQVLRIIGTVLDFNQEERDRIGLESAGASSSSGWFKSLLQPGKGPPNMQSLSEAFVRFLENESQPQPKLSLLPEAQEGSRSRSESRSDSPMSSQRRSPLLLSEVRLPTFTQFPVGRNSSSILKDVLKDS
ncbi:thyroid receptor-interacting protein 11 isoform X2 [Periplaneta americana]|uniref:thyroid receptor-interacting protein 11 isoform X2 n=1 Tax=Periplaneta americana TaxID=6978 RepID=UPI0037E7B4E9